MAIVVFSLVAGLTPAAFADQGSFTNSGGTASAGASFTVASSVASPGGSLSINCPASSGGSCSGGSFSYQSTDGSLSVKATFTSGSYTESCWGGGRGGHITCQYTFAGQIQGTLTKTGLEQAIKGVTRQAFIVGGSGPSGVTAYNSAYTPFYYSDSEQILRSDDLQGTNQISYGSQGSGIGQFYGAQGIALDLTGRIYVADTYNCRVVRIDNMKGANWTSYGSCGSGAGQFSDPGGIAIGPTGEIYVLDSGNQRIVRMDDMKATNWLTYGSGGAGTGQFSGYLQSIAVDAKNRIYIADTSNRRIVRVDDMKGTNWTALTHSPLLGGVTYSLQSPAAVALDQNGKIYIADNTTYQPEVLRVDDMNGTNWSALYVGSGAINSLSIDQSGLVFAGGGGVRLVDNLAGVLNSSGAIAPVGSYYVFGITHLPVSSPPPPAITVTPSSLHFANENVGAESSSQTVTLHNFGGASLEFSGIAATTGFVDTTSCLAGLVPDSSCTALVSFEPKAGGNANGTLTLTDNSGNLGSSQLVTLSGFATQPVANVIPGSLAFPAQVVNTKSASQSIMLLNTGNGPLQVASALTAMPFSATNNCGAPVAPGAACTIQIAFTPIASGAATGSLTISGNSGTQHVTLSGTGSAAAPPASLTPASLLFPPQLIGTTSATQTATITNSGNIALSNKGIGVTGDFVQSNNCGLSIAVGSKCTVTITFKPTAAGTRAGQLAVNLVSGALSIALSGTGSTGLLPPALHVSPSTLAFTGYVVGDNPSQTVTVTNASEAPTGILGIGLSGDASLTQSNNCPAVLNAAAGCSIFVTFVPVTGGTFISTLTVTEGSGTKDRVSISATAASSDN